MDVPTAVLRGLDHFEVIGGAAADVVDGATEDTDENQGNKRKCTSVNRHAVRSGFLFLLSMAAIVVDAFTLVDTIGQRKTFLNETDIISIYHLYLSCKWFDVFLCISRGALIWFTHHAMRTSKKQISPTPTLSELEANRRRIQIDLLDPASYWDAVNTVWGFVVEGLGGSLATIWMLYKSPEALAELMTTYEKISILVNITASLVQLGFVIYSVCKGTQKRCCWRVFDIFVIFTSLGNIALLSYTVFIAFGKIEPH